MILAGDVGGTKTRLALFAEGDVTRPPTREAAYASDEAPSFEALAKRFLRASGSPAIRAACLGVAGVVVGGRVRATNLPWELDEARLAAALGVPTVRLLNDLEATGYGVLTLASGGLRTLQAGAPPGPHATLALVAAGTGLGEAIVTWEGTRPRVWPSEGGQADFAPRTDVEAALWRSLRDETGHVSYERVLSGPGLVAAYRFLRRHRRRKEPGWLTERLAGPDPAAVVSATALADADPVCVEALDLFVSVYGAEAGNLALKALALGGVFVAGGIAPRILPALQAGPFLGAFRDKSRMAVVMAAIPVRVVLEPRTALLGAALRARAL